jgi:hypothetical protein
MKRIASEELAVAQRIIEFVQAQGWDVEGIEVYRYEDIGPFEHAEKWQRPARKWGLSIKVAPRDDEEPSPVPARE